MNLTVFVIDYTPKSHTPFSVDPSLATFINGEELIKNDSLVQTNSTGIFTMKIYLPSKFSEPQANELMYTYVYDEGKFKGNLLDVYKATNASQFITGKQFTLLTSVDQFTSDFAVLISADYYWKGPVKLLDNNSLQSKEYFDASNGTVIFHEITRWFEYPSNLFTYHNLNFTKNGTLEVYAGCATAPSDMLKVATITAENTADYEGLSVLGRCRTLVLTNGKFEWSKWLVANPNNIVKLNGRGVIMSTNYPYKNRVANRNYTIQTPSSNQMISVTYEVVQIPEDTTVTVQQNGNRKIDKQLTSSDKKFTSIGSNIENILFSIPYGSDGVFIRYSVVDTSSSAHWSFLILIFIVLGFHVS